MASKNQNQLETKIVFELRNVFLCILKVKKSKLNSPYYMESFDIKIDLFGG